MRKIFIFIFVFINYYNLFSAVISGRVINNSGSEGTINVILYKVSNISPLENPIRQIEASQNGIFIFNNVSIGRYTIIGFLDLNNNGQIDNEQEPLSCYTTTNNGCDTIEIVNASDNITNIVINIAPIIIRREASISGKIINLTRFSDAKIFAVAVLNPGTENRIFFEAVANNNGMYTIDSLMAGEYYVYGIIDTNYNDSVDTEDIRKCFSDEIVADSCSRIFLDNTEHLTDINITIGDTSNTYGSISGKVVNLTDDKTSDIYVKAFFNPNINNYSEFFIDKVDTNGFFGFDSLSTGYYLLVAFLDRNSNGDYDNDEIMGCYVDTLVGDTTCTKVMLRNNVHINDIYIFLFDNYKYENSSISGRILSNRDDIGPIRVVCENSDFHKELILDLPGKYIFKGLQSGFYKIWAFLDENADSLYNENELFACLNTLNNLDKCDSIYIGEAEYLKHQDINLLYPYLRIFGTIIDEDSLEQYKYIVYLKTDTLFYSTPFKVLNIGSKSQFFLDILEKNTYYLYVLADINKNNRIDDDDKFGFFDRDGDGIPDPLDVTSFMGQYNVEVSINYFIRNKIQSRSVFNGKVILQAPDYSIDYFKVVGVSSNGKVFRTNVSQDSTFSLSVSPGTYIIFTDRTEDFYRTYFPSTLYMDSASILTINNNDTINNIDISPIFKKIPKGGVRGFVFDSITNMAIENAVVRLSKDSVKFFKQTDTTGYFVFNKVKAGRYCLSISKNSYVTYKDSLFYIEADSVKEVNVKLYPYLNDTIVPEIQPIYPLPYATDIPVRASVIILFCDKQTGIIGDSIKVLINGENVNYTLKEKGKGYIFKYDPQGRFAPGDTINVFSEVQDLKNNKNQMEFFFVIQPDTTPPQFVYKPEIAQITEKSLSLSFVTNEKAHAIVKYFEKGTQDTIEYPIEGYQMKFSVLINNLKSNTVYKGFIELYDSYGNGPGKSNVFHCRTLAESDTIVPTFVNEPYLSYISDDKALIIFRTNELTRAVLIYDSTDILGDTIVDNNYRKSHYIQLDSLKPATEYFFQVKVFDRDSNYTSSELQKFFTKVSEDQSPPIFIKGPIISGITTNQATLFALTNEIASISISLEDTTGEVLSFFDDSLVKHKIALTNLQTFMKYTYSISAVDLNGNKTEAITGNFYTRSVGDTLLVINNIRNINSSNNSVIIMWENNKLTTGFVYYGTDINHFNIFEEPELKRFHSIVLSNLQEGMKYYFYIKSIDLAHNYIISDTLDFIFNQIEDLEPPIIIAGPKINVYNNKAVYQFKTDEPAIVNLTYWREDNPNLSSTITEQDFRKKHTLILADLLPSTSYEFTLTIKDINGNIRNWPEFGSGGLKKKSKDFFVTSFFDIYQTGNNSFNTNANADTTVPKIIEGPTAFERTDNYITLYWKTDEPAIGEVYYGQSNNLNEYQTESEYVVEHYFTFYNLIPASKYRFVIFNTDINSNGPEQYKDTLVYRTNLQVDNNPPRLIEEIKVVDITDDRAVIISTTDKASIAQLQLYNNEQLIKDYTTTFRKKKHKIFLTNLLPGSIYNSMNTFCDGNENCVTNISKDFETTTKRDLLPPKLIDSSIVRGQDYFRIYLSFDELSTVLLEYAQLENDNFISVSNVDPDTEHDLLVTNLEPNTVYKLKFYYQDTYGNMDSIVGIVTSTNVYDDTLAPNMPLGLKFGFDALNRLVLKWDKVLSDDIRGYNIYINFDTVFEKIATTIIDTQYIDDRSTYSGIEYAITAVDLKGNESQKNILKITSVEENNNMGKINKLVVLNNYPNPFNPSTTIKYYIPHRGIVEIEIFNIIGQRIYKFKKEEDAGYHTFIWSAARKKYSSGIYFYKIKFDKKFIIKKMLMIK